MRQTIRKLGTFGDVAASGTLVGITAIVNLCGMMVLARSLGPTPFGLYSTSRRVVAFVAPFVSLGGHLGVSRYLGFHTGDARQRSAVLVLGLVLCSATLPVTAALFALMSGATSTVASIDALKNEIWVPTILLAAVTATGLVVFSTLRGFGHPQVANMHQLTVLTSLLGIGLLTWGSPAVRILNLFAGSTALVNAIFLIWVVRVHRGEFVFPGRREFLRSVRELAPYSMSRLADGPLQASLSLVGILLAPGIGGLALSGYIHISQALVRMSEMLIVPLSVIFLPLVARQVREGQTGRLNRQAQMIYDSVALASCFLVIQGLIWARPLLVSAFGSRYVGATPFLMVTIPSMLPFLMFAGFRSFIDGYSVKPVNSLNLVVAALFVIGSSLSFGSMYNGVGLSMSYTLGTTILGLLSVTYAKRHFSMKVLSRHTLHAVCLAAGAGLIAHPIARASTSLSPLPLFLVFGSAQLALLGGLIFASLRLRHPTLVYARERIRSVRGGEPSVGVEASHDPGERGTVDPLDISPRQGGPDPHGVRGAEQPCTTRGD